VRVAKGYIPDHGDAFSIRGKTGAAAAVPPRSGPHARAELCNGRRAVRRPYRDPHGFRRSAIVLAAILDGIDGRLARLLKGTSRFGAELDSLSDFVNFGVAPALILYFWGLHDLKSGGWIAAMAFAICAGLRLARFNVMTDDPDRPAWAANFFVGVPAPAGAIIVLLPIYAAFLGLPRSQFLTWITLVYTLVIAWLLVSRLPVFSGKRVGTRVPREMVGPVVMVLVLSVALLIAYPWILLTIGTLAYLASLPFGLLSYRNYERRARHAKGEAASAVPPRQSPNAPATLRPANDEQRPARLN
jgi:CDP-diacylglycerol--serine O-phosphatidyltransferase